MGNHKKVDRAQAERAVRLAGKILAPSAVLGTGIALVAAEGTASAASVSTWDKVAACESGGNWSINTGNGYFGGLQFTSSTWGAYGGHSYAAQANHATKKQQILIAEKVLKGQGPGAWPVCGPRAGLSGGGPAPYVNTLTGSAGGQTKVTPKRAPVTSQAAMAAAYALAKIGKPYVYGAEGPNAFDCSGLTQAAWHSAGVSIPRTSGAQWSQLRHVAQPRIGDIVVYKGAGHVAIYVGNGKIVEAPRPGASVRTAPWRTGWYATHFTGIVRPNSKVITTEEAPAPAVVPKVAPKVAQAGDLDCKDVGHQVRVIKGRDPFGLDRDGDGIGCDSYPGPVQAYPGTVETPIHDRYTVKPGDWLSKISARYNLAGGWERLYALNRGVVGTNPDLIFPGQVLVLK